MKSLLEFPENENADAFFRRTCGYAAATQQTISIPAPGKRGIVPDGGASTGTVGSNADVIKTLQAILDKCKAPNGKVNGCAAFNGGNLMLAHY
jgi:hypothetical protein